MKVLILGIDGYIGWPLAQYLASKGHEVAGVDNKARRHRVEDLGGQSVVPIASYRERVEALGLELYLFSTLAHESLFRVFEDFQPDVVVNLAQNPSAPYSMQSRNNAVDCITGNVAGSMNVLWAMKEHVPEAHLITLGTMGEYGTPNGPILEPPIILGIPDRHSEKTVRWAEFAHYPRKPSSLYHSTKVAITHDTEAACRFWGLKATDVMQGVIYGLEFPGKLEGVVGNTRKDVDEIFGTALDRFLAQAAVGHPMTVYGTGRQTRGFLPLRDALQCLELFIDNPPEPGEYRAVNQFDEAYSIMELATTAYQIADEFDLDPVIAHVDNPRVEDEDHFYEPETGTLKRLGYKPAGDLGEECRTTLKAFLAHADRIRKVEHLLAPKTKWK